jgi:hypothetical protein
MLSVIKCDANQLINYTEPELEKNQTANVQSGKPQYCWAKGVGTRLLQSEFRMSPVIVGHAESKNPVSFPTGSKEKSNA